MKETDPKQTKRAKAYELWIKAPNPMVTFFKTLDVTPLIKKSKKSKKLKEKKKILIEIMSILKKLGF